MELVLQNSQTLFQNNTKIKSAHTVIFTKNLSGLYLLSTENLLSAYVINNSRSQITKQWDAVFESNSVLLVYIGKSQLFLDPRESLVVTKEPSGIVFYRANNIGLEKLATDTQLHDVGDVSIHRDTFLMGNIFTSSYNNPGLIYRKGSSRHVKIYAVNYSRWSDPHEYPLLLGNFQHPQEFSRADRVWIEPGWTDQNFILTSNETTLTVHKFNDVHQVELIGTASLPNKKDIVKTAQFIQNTSTYSMVVYYEGLAILFVYLEQQRRFAPANYFYFHGTLPVSAAPLIQQDTIFVCLEGPTIFSLKDNATRGFEHENSYWALDYLKPVAVFDSPRIVVYEQNEDTKLALFNIQEPETPYNFQEDIQVSQNSTSPLAPTQLYQIEQPSAKSQWSSYDKPILDNLQLKQFLEAAIHLPSGQLSVSLPMIPALNFGLQYSPNSQPGFETASAGKQWHQNGYSFVSLDPGQTHFETDKTFYIVISQSVYLLYKTSSRGSKTYFKLASEDDALKISSITFDSNQNQWIVKTDISVMTFGGTINSVKEGVQKRNWVLDTNSSIRLPLEWHLSKFENLVTRNTLHYEYLVRRSNHDGITYTKQVFLKKIQGQNIVVTFDINATDYELKGYYLRSSSYRQIVRFRYDTIGNQKYLSTISQRFYGSTETDIMRFEYDHSTDNSLLTKIALPQWKTKINYSYAVPPYPSKPSFTFSIPEKKSLKDVPEVASSAHGGGFSVFATQNVVIIYKITDGSTTNFTLPVQLHKDHKFSIENNCAFLLNQLQLSTFCATLVDPNNHSLEIKWKKMNTLSLSSNFNDVTMTATGTLLVKQDTRLLTLHQWNYESNNWNITSYPTSQDIKYVRMDEQFKVFTWLDEDLNVYWITGTKSAETKAWSWTSVMSKRLHNRYDCSAVFSQNFDLGTKTDKELRSFFDNFRFQLRDNIIAMTSCSITGWHTNTIVDLLILDNSGNAITKTFTIPQENIKSLRKEIANEDGQKFLLTYKKSLKSVKSHKEKFLVQVEPVEYSKQTAQATQEFRKAQESRDEKAVFLDFSDFSVYAVTLQTGSVVFFGKNKKIYHHSNDGWIHGNKSIQEEKNGSVSITLRNNGDDLHFEQEDPNSSFKLVNAYGTIEQDFGAKNATHLGFFYPNYIGVTRQVGSEDLRIIRFKGNSVTTSETYPREEILAGLSGPLVLASRTPNKKSHVLLRSQQWNPLKVVSKFDVAGSEYETRSVHYEFFKPKLLLNGQFVFHESHVMPGKVPKLYGWIQHDTVNTKNGTVTKSKIYDGYGNFLRDTGEDNPSTLNEEDNLINHPKYKLLDKYGQSKITTFFPFELSSCQAGYIGFEDYESMQSALNCPKWTFPKQNVHRNDFSFTGRNFLRLNASERLLMELPWVNDQSYTISAWVRAPSIKFEDVKSTLILMASLNTPEPVNWMSQVIYSYGLWTLLRLDVFGYQVSSFRKNFQNDTQSMPNANLKLEFAISGQNDTFVDVDNILFGPTTWDAEVNVMNPETFKITETILGRSGLISRDRFDTSGRPLVHINPRGQITHIAMHSTRVNNQALRSSTVIKSTETPGWYEYCDLAGGQALSFENKNNWRVSPGQIHHKKGAQDTLMFKTGPSSSLLFSFSYALKDIHANLEIAFFNTSVNILRKSNGVFLSVDDFSAPDFIVGEENFITLAVFDKARFAIWVDNELKYEKYTNTSRSETVRMKVLGKATISDVVFIPDPSIEINYFTLQNQEIQSLKLETAKTVIVSQKLYDELGRPFAETKKTVITSTNQSLLKFRQNFAIPKYETTSKMKLVGEVNSMNIQDEGYAFTRVKYQDNLMNEEWECEGTPGLNYHLGGKYEKKYSNQPHAMIKLLFPEDQGYSYRVIRTAQEHAYEETTVFLGTPKSELIRAKVALLPNGEQLLATYEYDFHGNLISAVAPEYHRKNRTFMKSQTYKQLDFTDTTFTSTYKFDSKSRLIEKINPDGGISNLVYDNQDNVIYAIHRGYKQPHLIDTILYFEYGQQGEGTLSEVGVLKHFNATAPVSEVLEGSFTKLPRKKVKRLDKQERNVFFQSDMIISHYDGQSDYIETVGYDVTTTRPVMRAEVIPTKTDFPSVLSVTRFDYNAKGDKVLQTRVPFQNFVIRNHYDLAGNLVRVDLVDSFKNLKLTVAEYKYTGKSQVVLEKLSDFGKNDTLVTHFSFNSPGYPIKQKNSLIEENMSYEDDGYGGFAVGKVNAVMTADYVRYWNNPYSQFSVENLLKQGLSASYVKTCLDALTKGGYVKDKKIFKLFYPGMTKNMPLACRAGSDSEKLLLYFLTQFIQQTSFKFKYQYGAHRDLIKAKFMEADGPATCTTPLTPVTLRSELAGIMTTAEVTSLWDALKASSIIVIDKQIGLASNVHGKQGLPMVNGDLLGNLTSLALHRNDYINDLVDHLGLHPTDDMTPLELSSIIIKWQLLPNPERVLEDAELIHRFLTAHKYLQNNRPTKRVFNKKFISVLEQVFPGQDYSAIIFKLFNEFFNCAITTSPFDFQVLDQDANGNFKLFYNGGQRIQLDYEEGTNKVSRLSTTEWGQTKTYAIGHDSFGNLNKAPHKNIALITYDEVFARPVVFRKSDGQRINIRYDHKGERVSKEIWSSGGKLLYRKKYLTRNEKGQCLLEEEKTFSSDDLPPKIRVTLYIYGPRGLVGFYRNGKLYNVYTDSIGSVRFVLLNGQVVASYDYLPYGLLMGKFVQHEDAGVTYLFTGQEWDEEIQLYNFHARMYDPMIGRFYQMDPKEQFFSPYKYGGNSPLNVVDPDGKLFGILIAIALAVVGAYIGAAAANKTWNVTKWNWKSPQTWIGIGVGALSGALIPVTGGQSIAVLTGAGLSAAAAKLTLVGVSVGVAYLSASAANKNIQFWKWDWKSPATFNAIFGGVAMGAGLPAGVGSWKTTFAALGTAGRSAFVVGSVGAFAGFGYLSAAGSQGSWTGWDGWSAVDFLIGGTGGVLGAAGVVDGSKYLAKQIKTFSPGFTNVIKSIRNAAVYRNPQLLQGLNKLQLISLGKASGSVAFLAISSYLGLASTSNDWVTFNFKDPATLLGLIDGFYGGWVGGVDSKNKVKKTLTERELNVKSSALKDIKIIEALEGKIKSFAKTLKDHLEREFEIHGDGSYKVKEKSYKVTCVGVMGGDNFMIAAISGADKNVGGLLVRITGSKEIFIRLENNVFEKKPRHLRPVTDIPNIDMIIRQEIDQNKVKTREAYNKAFVDNVSQLDLSTSLEPFKVHQVDFDVNDYVRTKLKEKFELFNKKPQDANIRSLLGQSIEETFSGLYEKQLAEIRATYTGKERGKKIDELKKKGASKRQWTKAASNIIDSSDHVKSIIDKGTLYQRDSRFQSIFDKWDPSNCAESHCLVGTNRASSLFHLPDGSDVNLDNVKYSAAYDYENLKDKNRCTNCMVTTEHLPSGPIKHIITDDGWKSQLTDLPELIDKLKKEVDAFDAMWVNPYPYFRLFTDLRNSTTLVEIPSHRTTQSTRGRSRRDVSNVSSSSTSVHNGIISNVVKVVKQIISDNFNNFVQPDKTTQRAYAYTDSYVENKKYPKPKKEKMQSKFNMEECLPYVNIEGEYRFAGFTCHSKVGSVKVFQMESSSPHVAALEESYNGDTYTDCHYLHGYLRQKTAFCKGQRSYFLYTPHELSMPFDKVNDHLMLLLLGVQLWKNMFDVQPEASATKSHMSNETLLQLERKVAAIKKFIPSIKALDDEFAVWVQYLVEDREDEIRDFESNGVCDEDLKRFEEIIQDLELEIEEVRKENHVKRPVELEGTSGNNGFWGTVCSYFVGNI